MINVSIDNVHISRSHAIRNRELMKAVLNDLRSQPSKVWKRSNRDLIREWRGHNLLYDLHLFRSHTVDVDLNYPTKWYEQVIWFILSQFYIS